MAQTVQPSKSNYSIYEEIEIRFSDVPDFTHVSPWVGIAPVGWPDNRIQDNWFTSSFPAGLIKFQPLQPGTYEVRLYFSSDNVVQHRATFTVGAANNTAPADAQATPGSQVGQAPAVPPEPLYQPQAGQQGGVPFPPPIAQNQADTKLVGSYDCYIYMGNQITYTQMGFTLQLDGGYEWGYEEGGTYRGDGGSYTVEGTKVSFTGAIADSVGAVKPKAEGKPSIELVPNGETWKTMYCSPR